MCCIATGRTVDATRSSFASAVRAKLAALREIGGTLPEPDCIVETLEIEDVA